MSPRGSLALMPRTRKGLVLFWTALFMLSIALQYASAIAPKGAFAANECESFSIFTTDVSGDINNENHYASKPEVYLNGGPGPSGELTPGTVIYYRVEEPDGTPLSEIRSTVVGADSTFRVQLAPFDTTTNNGNEYSVTASQLPDLKQGSCTKNDNFKVDGPGSLKVTKAVNGGPAGFSGSFPISIDCGLGGVHTGTIVFPTPGFITFTGLDAKASCTVTEGTLPAPPAGYTWGTPSYTGNPAVIVSGGTVNAGVVNTLNVIPAPAFTVDKGVSTSAAGPFVGNLSVGTGTLLHYRITITNTGNVPLSGVTLSDNTYDLVAKGCVVPTTLAVGAHYDCNYTATAVSGTTTNVATGDTTETPPDTGTATVTASDEPVPGFTVDKGVSLTAGSGYVPSLTTTTGTTVYYRIMITNTGNVALTGVTLSDNMFNLVEKGCVIPTSLAVGANFVCDYAAIAANGTTTNIATGDTDQTGPDTGTATVVASPTPVPSFTVDKSVSLSAEGPYVASLTTTTGMRLHYRITITNTGNVALTGVTLSDNTYNLGAKGCVIPTTLAVGANYICHYTATAVTGTTTNVATGDTGQTEPDTGTATVVASPGPNPTLTIEKTNNAATVNGLPTATAGSTVTYTLSYTFTGDSVSGGIITDVLPAGLTYVAGTATSNIAFDFQNYNPGLRTLTWRADEITASGSVTYQATVNAGAAALVQPLTNVATIDSDDTAADSDNSFVFVPAPVLAETSVPTAPRTDALGSTGSSTAGTSLLLVLLALAGVAFALVMVTPVPAKMRDRSRRR